MFSSNGTQVAADGAFIEDVFSTFLYTGTGATQTITNGIDLSTKGGLVWCKARSVGNHGRLFDTVRGVQKAIYSSLTSEEATESTALTAFNTNGFTLGSNDNINGSGATNVSWTFRKQKKFFDIVTYTGNGASNRAIAHNLGSAPGCVIVKSTSNAQNWPVFHRSTGANTKFWLNATNANAADVNYFPTAPDATSFYVGTDTDVNQSGYTYVVYLFAHDAGGFGLTGNDNAISCGSFTYVSGTLSVNLGYEPQWVMIKQTDGAGSWFINDNMRNWRTQSGDGGTGTLYAQSSNAEGTGGQDWHITSTGFNVTSGTGTFIYIAIRRGPMGVPTLGTSVYNAIARTGTGAATTVTGVGFAPDLMMVNSRAGAAGASFNWDRLRGPALYLDRAGTPAEVSAPTSVLSFNMDGISIGTDTNNIINYSVSQTYINWFMKRAAGFFDIVCYTGTGSARTISHNLTVAPEMVIIKSRSAAYSWPTLVTPIGGTDFLFLDSTSAKNSAASYFNNTYPTASVFSVGTNVQVNESGSTFVAYLFATCTGVSKVGSYTGTATTNQINCGFTAGARFVLIKRYDGGSTGDWYVWDSVRGIVAGNDPYVRLNLAAAEVTNTDYIDTYSAGFELSSTAPAAINASGGTFIFLAIA